MDKEDQELELFFQQGIPKEEKVVSFDRYRWTPLDYKAIYKEENYNPQNSAHVGPTKPQGLDPTKVLDSSDSGNSEEEDSFEEQIKKIDFEVEGIPMTHAIDLKGHSKGITAIAIDNSACRMVSGGGDFSLRFWDFPNMNQSFQPFYIKDSTPGQPPRNIVFSYASTHLLVTGGNAKPKVLTRDGRVELEFVKGDMYIQDPQNCRGHISIITSGHWHPVQQNLTITSSLDSTIRIWDVNGNKIGIEQDLPSMQVLRCKNKKGTKAGVWQCDIAPDGNNIIAACQDGSFQVFTTKNKYSRAELQLFTESSAQVTHLKYFYDGYRFLSRSQDNTMKLYDTRKLTRAIYSWYELDNNHEQTQIALSPDEGLILTGTSATKTKPGCVVFINADTYEELTRVPVTTGKVSALTWNEQLNQLIVGAGSDIKCFFSPKLSQDGVMLGSNKQQREWRPDDFEPQRPVFVPHAPTLFNTDKQHRRETRETIRSDKSLSRLPDRPLDGPGRGGKVGGPITLIQDVLRNITRIDKDKIQDPVEAVRRNVDKASNDPVYVNEAYSKTQPTSILDFKSQIHDEQKLISQFKKCPRCGLKLCHCNKSIL